MPARAQYEPLEGAPWSRFSRGIVGALVAGAIAIVLVVVVVVVVTGGSDDVEDAQNPLIDAVTSAGIMAHLRALNTLAKDHPNRDGVGSRSVLFGYNASADYVRETLRAEGYSPMTQVFQVPVWEQEAVPTLSIEDGDGFQVDLTAGRTGTAGDFVQTSYGGIGPIDLSSMPVGEAQNFGCNETDYAGAEGAIVLVQHGDCDYGQKGVAAEAAGVAGVFLYFDPPRPTLPGSRVRTTAWTEGDPVVSLPFFAVSSTTRSLALKPGALVHLSANSTLTFSMTSNVCVDSTGGEATRTVVMGAHLDSVPEGPGLDDNGSGSAVLLEIFLQMHRTGYEPKNRLRFCWWGAEEIGLLGSYHYVRTLSEADLREIVMDLNVDMLASPNYVRFVHATNEDTPWDAPTTVGANVIQGVLEESLDAVGVPYATYPLACCTDFVPFLEAGIPANGYFTGAAWIKTMEERSVFGGWTDAIHDTCYHMDCDDIDNIDVGVLGEMASATVRSMIRFGDDGHIRDTLTHAPPSTHLNRGTVPLEA